MSDNSFEYITTDYMVSVNPIEDTQSPTVEYIVELGQQGLPGAKGEPGEPGFSPVVTSVIDDNTIRFTLVNKDEVSTTPNFYDLLAKKDLSNTTYADDMANKLDKDGANADSPITLNKLIITAGTTMVADVLLSTTNNRNININAPIRTINNIQLSPSGTTGRVTYKGNELATLDDIPEVPDVSNFLNKDGSNAASTINLQNVSLTGNIQTVQPNFYISNNKASNGNITVNTYDGDIYLSPDSSHKLYYRNKEIATLSDIPTIGNGVITIKQGDVTKGTFTTNQSGNAIIELDEGGGGGAVNSVNGQTGTVVLTASDVGALADTTTIPSKTSDLTNDSGFITGITSSDVTTALGYTPYNSTNPSGYITSSALNGYATETWVGNQGYLTGITSSDVVTALTYTPYNGATNPNGYITSADLPTNYVTTDTAQDISGRKTFLGEKAIYFKQQKTSNKLGFTLYNPSNTELAALEYRPNTIGSASLLALNCPQTTGGYVGFKYWGTPAVNIVAPKVATAGNYYIPINVTNGTLTVTANNVGTLDISTLLPDVSSFVTNTSLATTLASYVTSANLTTILADYALTSQIPTVNNPTITFTQGGVNKGTITLNQSNNQTIALDAGGGGGVTNPIALSETIGGNTYNLNIGIDKTTGNLQGTYTYPVSGGTDTSPLFSRSYGLVNAGLSNNYTTVNGYQTNQLSVKVDNSTIGFDSNGALTVTGSYASITDLDDKVSKSGDTMTGTLNINTNSKALIIPVDNIRTGGDNGNLQDVEFQYNNIRIATIRGQVNDNGTRRIDLGAHNADGSWGNTLALIQESGGTSYALCPTPADNQNNTRIVTGEYLKKHVDGQWVSKVVELVDDVTMNNTTRSVSMNNVLPNDGRIYEVLFNVYGRTGTASGNYVILGLNGNIAGGCEACRCVTRSASYATCGGNCIIPCRYGTNITLSVSSNANATNINVTARAYRRVGINT